MVSITLAVPDEVRKLMKQFPEINWSGFVRKAIEEKAGRLKMKQELSKELERERDFTDWSVELGRKAKKGRFSRVIDEINN